MRIRDWSSEVGSSDLWPISICRRSASRKPSSRRRTACSTPTEALGRTDRKSVVQGKSVAVRVDLDGGRIIKKTSASLVRTDRKRVTPRQNSSLLVSLLIPSYTTVLNIPNYHLS